MTLTMSNRLLNEVSNFMKTDGYGSIARHFIDPIVSRTAEARQETAVIEDEKTISDINFVIGKMKKQGNISALRLIQQHLVNVAAAA